jgi:hypothetical protein
MRYAVVPTYKKYPTYMGDVWGHFAWEVMDSSTATVICVTGEKELAEKVMLALNAEDLLADALQSGSY